MTSDGKQVGRAWWADLVGMLCVALVTGLCMLAVPRNGMAATIMVNSLEDTVVSGDGACTLREAILNAERDNRSGSTDCAAGSGADTITFSVSGTISVPSGLSITSPQGLTIDGGGRVTISCENPADPDPFGSRGGIGVAPGGVLTLTHLTVADGFSIGNSGTMTISHSTVRGFGGRGVEGPGGGIDNSGTMTISNSTVSDNLCGECLGVINTPHGGIPNRGAIRNSGALTISTSTLRDNSFSGYHYVCPDEGGPSSGCSGGAISNAPESTLTISNSTVSGNRPGRFVTFFSGIYNEGTLTLSSSTVSGNTVSDSGTGVYNTGTVKLSTTVIADGCSGPITSLGYNLDQAGSCGLTGPGDKPNTDPRLDPAGLKDNGGPTKTLALCTGSGTPAGCTGKSPAIDAIPTANCTGAGGNPLGIDQRGFFRPADGDRNGTVLCDIGAFEATSSPLVTLNSLATFTPLPATYQTSRDTTGCPAGSVGQFRFTADLTNKPGSPPVKHLVAEVATLTKGNLVLNADGGLGGAGATVTFSPNGQYTDGVLSAKDHVTLPFTLCLKTFDRFTFFVNVLGTR